MTYETKALKRSYIEFSVNIAKLRAEQVAKCYKPGDVALEDVTIWCDDNDHSRPIRLHPAPTIADRRTSLSWTLAAVEAWAGPRSFCLGLR